MHTKYLFPLVVSGMLAGSAATSGDNMVAPPSTSHLVISQFKNGGFSAVRHSMDMQGPRRIVFDVGPFDGNAPLYVDYQAIADLPAASVD